MRRSVVVWDYGPQMKRVDEKRRRYEEHRASAHPDDAPSEPPPPPRKRDDPTDPPPAPFRPGQGGDRRSGDRALPPHRLPAQRLTRRRFRGIWESWHPGCLGVPNAYRWAAPGGHRRGDRSGFRAHRLLSQGAQHGQHQPSSLSQDCVHRSCGHRSRCRRWCELAHRHQRCGRDTAEVDTPDAPILDGSDIVAHVVDARSGRISLFVGTKQIDYTNQALAQELLNATR